MGHIFQLGRLYAEVLDLKVLDENGKLTTPTMGSYGVGVSRAVAAIVENSHDELGIIWPREVAPADLHLVATGKDPAAFEFAEALSLELEASGVRVLYDDRNGVSPGVKFKDAELLGMPTHRGGRQEPRRGRDRGPRPCVGRAAEHPSQRSAAELAR